MPNSQKKAAKAKAFYFDSLRYQPLYQLMDEIRC
jgi:hypothetical protein